MARDQLSPDVPGAAAAQGESAVPSRRVVLRGAAGVGAAGIAATAFAGLGGQAFAAAGRPEAAEDRHLAGAAGSDSAESTVTDTEPIVAHVRDARTGQIDLFRGTSQLRVQDKGLAAQLAKAADEASLPAQPARAAATVAGPAGQVR